MAHLASCLFSLSLFLVSAKLYFGWIVINIVLSFWQSKTSTDKFVISFYMFLLCDTESDVMSCV